MFKQRILRLGTRGSQLALAQTQIVSTWLQQHNPDLVLETVIITTGGDQQPDVPLTELGRTTQTRRRTAGGSFVKEIENALLAEQIDIAVHSLKDLPAELPAGLELCCPLPRQDARDALVGGSLENLPAGARIGTGSPRRQMQLAYWRPDCQFDQLRGNVGTRLEKLAHGKFSAVVLAMAGLNRLGLTSQPSVLQQVFPLSFEQCLPSAGQAIIGLEYRSSQTWIGQLCQAHSCPDTNYCATAERCVLQHLGLGCSAPLAVFAEYANGQIRIRCRLGRSQADEPSPAEPWIAVEVWGPVRDTLRLAASAADLCRRRLARP